MLVLAVLAFLVRRERSGFRLALAAAILYALALAAWMTIVAPANGVLATWTPGPIPADFRAVRDRWEVGHLVVAALKLAGLAAAVLSLLSQTGEASRRRT